MKVLKFYIFGEEQLIENSIKDAVDKFFKREKVKISYECSINPLFMNPMHEKADLYIITNKIDPKNREEEFSFYEKHKNFIESNNFIENVLDIRTIDLDKYIDYSLVEMIFQYFLSIKYSTSISRKEVDYYYSFNNQDSDIEFDLMGYFRKRINIRINDRSDKKKEWSKVLNGHLMDNYYINIIDESDSICDFIVIFHDILDVNDKERGASNNTIDTIEVYYFSDDHYLEDLVNSLKRFLQEIIDKPINNVNKFDCYMSKGITIKYWIKKGILK